MCGIVGYLSANEEDMRQKIKFIHDGLIFDTARGKDSTGVFVPTESDNTYVMKGTFTGSEFVRTDHTDFLFRSDNKYPYVVGHNRAATIGSVIPKNAHPFREGPVTMVHNGSLRGTYQLPLSMIDLNKSRGKDHKITVDSQVLAANVAHKPFESFSSDITGAFALVWHDSRTNTLNFVRNKERPLHFAYSECGNHLLFMSEADMLRIVAMRSGIKLRSVFTIEPGLRLTFDLSSRSMTPVTSKVPLKQPPKVYDYSQSYYRSRGNDSHYQIYKVDVPQHLRGKIDHNYKKMPVPANMLSTLKDVKLLPEDECLMLPITFSPYKGTRGSHGNVWGQMVGSADPVLITNVRGQQYTNYDEQPWVVSPRMVSRIRVHDNRKYVKIIIAQLLENSSQVEFPPGFIEDLSILTNKSALSDYPLDHRVRDWIEDAYEASREDEDEDLAFEDLYCGPKNTTINIEDFLVRTRDGCFWCRADIRPEDHEDVHWDSKENPICPSCAKHIH